jgi:hypothetical protein
LSEFHLAFADIAHALSGHISASDVRQPRKRALPNRYADSTAVDVLRLWRLETALCHDAGDSLPAREHRRLLLHLGRIIGVAEPAEAWA